MTALSAREGYRLWADSYADETAISFLETEITAELTPPLEGLRLLDAGCGTGRRLHGTGAALAIGVDLSPEMLAAGVERDPYVETMVGDVRELPLPGRAFDVIWCRLVIGHLPDCAPAYRELARVATGAATLVVTDFHPAAYAAGHRRTFRHDGQVLEVEHYVHDFAQQIATAKAAGWRHLETRSAVIGPHARPFYEKAGRASLYAEHEGLPVVLGLAFEREG
ncbi:MAG: class I SAM-dependent methyltransferase [Caulobacteraceae bacterium]